MVAGVPRLQGAGRPKQRPQNLYRRLDNKVARLKGRAGSPHRLGHRQHGRNLPRSLRSTPPKIETSDPSPTVISGLSLFSATSFRWLLLFRSAFVSPNPKTLLK